MLSHLPFLELFLLFFLSLLLRFCDNYIFFLLYNVILFSETKTALFCEMDFSFNITSFKANFMAVYSRETLSANKLDSSHFESPSCLDLIAVFPLLLLHFTI